MTRYREYSDGIDGTYYAEYVCDLCDKTIQLAEDEALPDGWLSVGVDKDKTSTGHICPSCRYLGAEQYLAENTMSLVTKCQGCGRPLVNVDVFDPEYEHCRNFCCGCCPSKDGFKGEACQQDFIKRKRGEPVGIMATLDQF